MPLRLALRDSLRPRVRCGGARAAIGIDRPRRRGATYCIPLKMAPMMFHMIPNRIEIPIILTPVGFP